MTPVFDGAAPVAFTDLDLSSLIGSTGRFAVELAADREYCEFRPKGNTSIGNPFNQALRGCGGGFTIFADIGNVFGCIVFTDAASVVQWIQSTGNATKVYLLGWYDVTDHNAEALGPEDFSATALPAVSWGSPGPFQDVDLSSIIGASGRIVILEYAWDSGTSNARSIYIRPDGGSLLPHQSNGGAPRGPSNPQLNSVHPVQILVPTSSLGVIEQAFWVFSATADIWVHGYLEDWTVDNVVIATAVVPPTSIGTSDLDVTGLVDGAIAGVAYLEVSRPGVADLGTLISLSFRGSGDTTDPTHPSDDTASQPRGTRHVVLDAEENAYVWVEVGPDGHIEWEASANTYPISVTVLGHVPTLAFTVETIEQTSLNTVDVNFDKDPKFLDPVDPTDASYLNAYTITGPVSPFPERLLQAVTHEGDGVVRLWFDGELVEGETYFVSIAGIETDDGDTLFPSPATGSFVAFGADFEPIPLMFERTDAYDLKNPQVSRDAEGATLGTLSVDETGDLAVETRRQYLKKRILRRCTTSPGGFAFLVDYGLYPGAKSLLRPSELRKLQQNAETQVAEEPGVVSVRAVVRQIVPGVVQLRLNVIDQYGPLTIDTPIGGDSA